MDKKDYWKKVITTAAALGVLACVPQYINWGFNATIFGTVAVNLFQLVIITAVLYSFGKQVAVASDKGDGYEYGKAYGFAIMASLISGIFSAFLAWVLMNVIDPAETANTVNKAMVLAQDQGLNDEQIQMAMSMTKFFISFPGLLTMNVLSMGVSGGLIGLVTSALVKRNPQL